VAGEGGAEGEDAGKCSATYTIAVNTARASSGAVPAPCGRGMNCGINGSTSAHNSSGTNRNDKRSTTPKIIAQQRATTTQDTL
jgi:hypothetical protein